MRGRSHKVASSRRKSRSKQLIRSENLTERRKERAAVYGTRDRTTQPFTVSHNRSRNRRGKDETNHEIHETRQQNRASRDIHSRLILGRWPSSIVPPLSCVSWFLLSSSRERLPVSQRHLSRKNSSRNIASRCLQLCMSRRDDREWISFARSQLVGNRCCRILADVPVINLPVTNLPATNLPVINIPAQVQCEKTRTRLLRAHGADGKAQQ